MVSEGWGNTKGEALDQALSENLDFFEMAKTAGEKQLKRLRKK